MQDSLTERRTRAPGKLVWLGEYAVLDGAPAIVAAVDRYADVHAVAADGWTLRGVNLDATPRSWPDAGARADDDPLALAAALLDVLHEHDALQADQPRALLIDTQALFLDGQKIGVGSSAAALVALYRCVARDADDAARAFGLINAAHQRVQKGLGSGVDVAAALHGGVSVFERDPRVGLPRMTPVQVPDNLFMGSVFTGASTSTAQFLARVAIWRQRANWEYSAYRDALAGLAAAGVTALSDNDAAEFCVIAERYAEALSAFGVAAGIDIYSEIHKRLVVLAREVGVSYKTSGAGGRDLGVAFATDPDALQRFMRRADQLGQCRTLQLSVAPPN